MIFVVEQTREEKMAMYMKLTKRELVEMLFNANDMLSHRTQRLKWLTDGVYDNVAGWTFKKESALQAAHTNLLSNPTPREDG